MDNKKLRYMLSKWNLKNFRQTFFIALLFVFMTGCNKLQKVTIISGNQGNRIAYAVKQLNDALTEYGYECYTVKTLSKEKEGLQIILGTLDDPFLKDFIKDGDQLPDTLSEEGFVIRSGQGNICIAGGGASGALYGALELIDQLRTVGELPAEVNLIDQPEMVMRGTCIGLQKTEYLPGRSVYEYPYTPENFPWFYDKNLWIKYLDMLVENRYNSFYLWNGHPFASLVKLKDYSFAVEVDEETLKKNEEMFDFITTEADKRGIWVIQMFYNIIVSKPFAGHYNIKTQDRSRPIIPVISDYTRKSIAAFIEKYPNVGLLVTLGEAMNTIDDDVEWFTKTIIPGVKDGLAAIGKDVEPPIVLRGHDTDAKRVMEAALPVYKNLYTTYKYNGESLTTYEPRDEWSSIPTALSRLGSVHIANVHILANLEPFRYGSPDFIQKSVKAMHTLQGANGLHLYPQASYWDWPYSADKTNPRLLEMERDWIWYQTWGRYAWDCHRNRENEVAYWSRELDNYYGSNNGQQILEAYEQTGEIAPKLLRTFGISDGNRQTLLLGMFMGQLVNPFKYHVYDSFLSSNGPEGEILVNYAQKEWEGTPHTGETPPQIVKEVLDHARKAVDAIDIAARSITKNKEEFARLKNDVYCYNQFAEFFAAKEEAAEFVLHFKYSGRIGDLKEAVPLLEKSVTTYKKLIALTENTYLYANSMQTAQRRIPISGRDGTNKTWKELLPYYQKELENFKRNVRMLEEKGDVDEVAKKQDVLEALEVTVLNKDITRYPLTQGVEVYSDNPAKILKVADELKKLSGVRISDKQQQKEGTILKFKSGQPVKVLVGYFNANSYTVLQPPTLETNANANDRGQADIKIANAMLVDGLYPVNIYTYKYGKGEHELRLGKGRVLILGFIDGSKNIAVHDAGMGKDGSDSTVDWLFY
jgi:tetratricopeptide (TPR) repeat protein